MEHERNRVLAGERISRAQVEAVEDSSDSAIRAALDACDHERAAMLAIARARRGERVPLALVAEVLPGIELPAIACALLAIADGDRAALLDLIARRRFPPTKDAAELEAIVLYAAWRAGAPPARVAPPLRRLAARSMTAESCALLATIAASIDDANVAQATKHIAAFAKDYAKQVASDEHAMTASVADVIASLPAEVEVSVGGFTVRAAKQVGRNDPCPCGSGLKYKKCCADKPVATPSPIPGVSWDDFLGARAGEMTSVHIDELAAKDLARVDPTHLAEPAVMASFQRWRMLREWSRAERALDELVRRGSELVVDARHQLVHELLGCRELSRARLHVAQLPAHDALCYQVELAIADDKDAWATLESSCDALLRGIDGQDQRPAGSTAEQRGSIDSMTDVDLAYSLLRAAPAVGIYVARACIGMTHIEEAELLLDAVEDARDELGLPPSDPAWSVLDRLDARARPPEDDATTRLRTSLAESTSRIDELERSLAATRAELQDARTLPAAALAKAPETKPTGLDARVRDLEAMIREGNAERRELRDKLSASEAQTRSHRDEGHRGRRAAPDAGQDVDDAETEAVAGGARGIVVPRFERKAADAFADVPGPVAAEAMRTIGTLAAGDGFAWRNVKQAKDMIRAVLMARVGIHHRLLFRVESGTLEVLDLITREQLLTTLKRLRALR
jgi:hypothetical protein